MFTRYIAARKALSGFCGCIVGFPPAFWLSVIIGLAVLVTMVVTGRVSRMEQCLKGSKVRPAISAPAQDLPAVGSIFLSTRKISAGTIIDKSMIEQNQVSANLIADDAAKTNANVVGRTTKNNIPAWNQLREIDLK